MTEEEILNAKARVKAIGEALGADKLLFQVIKYAVTKETILEFVAAHIGSLTREQAHHLMDAAYDLSKIDLMEMFDQFWKAGQPSTDETKESDS